MKIKLNFAIEEASADLRFRSVYPFSNAGIADVGLERGTGENSTQTRGAEASGNYAFANGNNTKAISDNTDSNGFLSIAGSKGFQVTGGTVVDSDNGIGRYYLSSTEGLAVTMRYSVFLATTAVNCGEILDVSNDSILVNGYPGIALSAESDNPQNYVVNNYLTIVGRPELGDEDVGFHAHAEGEGTMAQGKSSHAEGKGTKALGQGAHAEGRNTVAGYYAHAEGLGCEATGYMAHAEGEYTKATGNKGHAEGAYTIAGGTGSHAEGYKTESTGLYSHSEGYQTKSVGQSSHAEGQNTVAAAYTAHAEGEGTKTYAPSQHVQGKFNKVMNLNYAHVLGNGTSENNRSNAHWVDWDGNAWYAGGVRVGPNATKLATEGYVLEKTNLGLEHGEGEDSTQTRGSSASGTKSHAEGAHTKATNTAAHSEGYQTEATGMYSHSEGYQTKSVGQSSHAEGQKTVAAAFTAHAEGAGTETYTPSQHVQGRYNVVMPYAHILGNGTDEDHRSNAHWIDWGGNAWYAGSVEGKEVIIRSSSEGSTKRFKITVDDSGTVTATEVV